MINRFTREIDDLDLLKIQIDINSILPNNTNYGIYSVSGKPITGMVYIENMYIPAVNFTALHFN